MKTKNTQSRTMLFTGLGFLAIPILLFGSTLLEIDESGISTVYYFVMIGIPASIIGLVMAIASSIVARKESKKSVKSDTTIVRIIKVILISIILIAFSLPILYILNFFFDWF